MATSQRLLAIAIFAVLVAGIATAVVKDSNEEPSAITPTQTATPTPTETFTFPGPAPTDSESPLFPTDTAEPTEPGAEPTETMTELPRTGRGSVALPALLTLFLAIAGGLLVRRTTRADS